MRNRALSSLRATSLCGALLLWACSNEPTGIGHGETADLLFRGGVIYTVNPQQPRVDVVAVRAGKIVFAGSAGEASQLVDTHTRIVDLHGRMLLPGFQDAHTHPIESMWGLQQCSLADSVGRTAVLARIAECAKAHPNDDWIYGEGWHMDLFPPDGVPDKALLDAIAPDKIVALASSDGHSLWVNSKALQLAGLTAATPDPAGGRIDRYPGSREPAGGLEEDTAMSLVTTKKPPVSDAELIESLRAVQKYMNQLGITAVQDASVYLVSNDAYRALPAYRALAEKGELTMHVRVALHYDPHQDLATQVAGFRKARADNTLGMLDVGTVKIFQDGVMENQTAAMLAPYVGQTQQPDMNLVEPEKLKSVVTAFDKKGFQVHFHAIGDGAVRAALDALEAARNANGSRDSRHHISHLELIDPADIPRFKALDAVANFQPLWAYRDSYIRDLTIPKIGVARSRWLYPIGSVINTGAHVAFGSDWSVSSANPLWGIETAVTRIDADSNTGEPLFAAERISREQAIAAYTIEAARVNFLDTQTGSIEVGKQADLIVLDRDLLSVPAAAISDIKVTATLLAGRVVSGAL